MDASGHFGREGHGKRPIEQPRGAPDGPDWAAARHFGFRNQAPMYRAMRYAVDPAGQRQTIQNQGNSD